jgi:hypothetical protein
LQRTGEEVNAQAEGYWTTTACPCLSSI